MMSMDDGEGVARTLRANASNAPAGLQQLTVRLHQQRADHHGDEVAQQELDGVGVLTGDHDRVVHLVVALRTTAAVEASRARGGEDRRSEHVSAAFVCTATRSSTRC